MTNPKYDIYLTSSQRSTSMVSHDFNPTQLRESLKKQSLKDLRIRKKRTDKAIETVLSKIEYMRRKESEQRRSISKIRHKQQQLERIYSKAKQQKQKNHELYQKHLAQIEARNKFNRMLRDHLENNKQVVEVLNQERRKDKRKKLRQQKQQLKQSIDAMKNTIIQNNINSVNRVKIEKIVTQRKKRFSYFDNLHKIKRTDQSQLSQEKIIREKHENKLQQLQQKEQQLLEKYTQSKRFKIKCEEQYLIEKHKYHSFYSNFISTRNLSLRPDISDSKCNIFL